MAKKVCVLFGNGVEEIELVVPVDIFRRSGVEATLVSAESCLQVSGAHGVKLVADVTLANVEVDDFDVLLLPGGPGTFALKDSGDVLDFVKLFHSRGKLICAICAAPLILNNAGVLENRKFCSHPCAYSVLKNVDRAARVVVDGNLITAKGPGVAHEFAFSIIEFLSGKEVSAKMRTDLFFQEWDS
jgi:4-methyl-5(b-hydroxyethyl)-thiazole monophosphate biosynthesis